MKKSNLFLMLSAGLALTWTVFIGIAYSVAINRDIEGKSTSYAFSHTQALEKNKIVFPAPGKKLIISGNKAVSINVTQGKELSVKTLPTNALVSFSELPEGVSVISIKSLESTNESVYITVPPELYVKIRHLFYVSMSGFDCKSLDLELSNLESVSIEKSKIGKLKLEILYKVDITNVSIEKSCEVDSLFVRIPGKGNLNLQTYPRFKRVLDISDSVVVSSVKRNL